MYFFFHHLKDWSVKITACTSFFFFFSSWKTHAENVPFVSKLTEKLVFDKRFRYLDHNNLWHIFQSAYCRQQCTKTALLRVFVGLLTASDSGSISILTLQDLSAAFDTIDHGILTRLERTFGIRDLALPFFRFNLQDRTQVVTVNEIKILSFISDLWGPPGFRLGAISLHSVYSASSWSNQSQLGLSWYVCVWH